MDDNEKICNVCGELYYPETDSGICDSCERALLENDWTED
jgi:RNA polymerase subunit RPABC4/transcription elongation factor Spt4